MYEGGGACWEKGSCENKAGTLLAAVNPDGIPANYLQDWNRQAHLGLVTPFTARIDPIASVQTQSWNIVYLTYCTGDVHTGNKVTTYTDETGSIAWYHRGGVNAKAVTAWMAANMPKPEVLLLTGFSAGGTGSTANFPHNLGRQERRPACRFWPLVLGTSRQFTGTVTLSATARQDPRGLGA